MLDKKKCRVCLFVCLKMFFSFILVGCFIFIYFFCKEVGRILKEMRGEKYNVKVFLKKN